MAISISVVAGMLIGNQFSNQKYISDNDRKLNTILNLIAEEYVDTVKINDLIETSIPEILSNLDCEVVTIKLADPSRPCLVVPAEQDDKEDVLMLIMPMLLND